MKPPTPVQPPVAELKPAVTVSIEDIAIKSYITVEQMAELSRLLGSNLESTDDLISRCKHISIVNVEGEPIHFESGLLSRLKSRCPTSVEFGPWLRERIIQWAHGYCGW
jgi:hypothetical protein